MRIALMGAPGSGKSWLGQALCRSMKLKHIEGDELFWTDAGACSLESFRQKVREQLNCPHWVFEGHLGKVADLVLPQVDQLIEVDFSPTLSLLRALGRESSGMLRGPHRWRCLQKIHFNLQNHHKLQLQRRRFTGQVNKCITWRNGVDSVEHLIQELQS